MFSKVPAVTKPVETKVHRVAERIAPPKPEEILPRGTGTTMFVQFEFLINVLRWESCFVKLAVLFVSLLNALNRVYYSL